LVLKRKSIGAEAFAVQNKAVMSGMHPIVAAKLRELMILRTQIAAKVLAGPGCEAVSIHRLLLADWNARKNKLETEVAQELPEMNLKQRLQRVSLHA
jgi:hypothetical protein